MGLVSLLDVGFLGAAVVVTRLALKGDARIDALGFLASALNIVMYGSPLVAMVKLTTHHSGFYSFHFISLTLPLPHHPRLY